MKIAIRSETAVRAFSPPESRSTFWSFFPGGEATISIPDSPAFAYLARLILEDERRHHQLLDDLAETIRNSAELFGEPSPIPDLALFKADRERILAETERFIAVEKEDNEELEHLAKDLKDVRNTTIWQLVVRLMQDDNAKHRRILEFIRDRAREQND